MTSKHYDLIIFDCDGTLVDSEDINNRAVSEILISLGYSHYTTEYCTDLFAGMSLPNLLLYLDQEIKQTLPSEAILQRFIARSSVLAQQYLQAIPYAHTLLSQLSHPKCVASNGERSSVVEALSITGLDMFFPEDVIFTHEQVKKGKPEPDLFLFAAERMGVKPHNCLVIEDSPTGIKAAKAAGMTVIGFSGASHHNSNTQQQLEAILPDMMIGHLSEVLNYV